MIIRRETPESTQALRNVTALQLRVQRLALHLSHLTSAGESLDESALQQILNGTPLPLSAPQVAQLRRDGVISIRYPLDPEQRYRTDLPGDLFWVQEPFRIVARQLRRHSLSYLIDYQASADSEDMTVIDIPDVEQYLGSVYVEAEQMPPWAVRFHVVVEDITTDEQPEGWFWLVRYREINL